MMALHCDAITHNSHTMGVNHFLAEAESTRWKWRKCSLLCRDSLVVEDNKWSILRNDISQRFAISGLVDMKAAHSRCQCRGDARSSRTLGGLRVHKVRTLVCAICASNISTSISWPSPPFQNPYSKSCPGHIIPHVAWSSSRMLLLPSFLLCMWLDDTYGPQPRNAVRST